MVDCRGRQIGHFKFLHNGFLILYSAGSRFERLTSWLMHSIWVLNRGEIAKFIASDFWKFIL
jgi:hypothetical protein